MNWQPMATAPKGIITVLDLPSLALKNGKRIKVRGEGEEFLAAWAESDVGGLYWVDLESGEPIDWPLAEWRDLTPEELQSDEL